MSSHEPTKGVSQESIAAGHETTDAEPKNIVVFTIWLTVTLVITIGITFVLYGVYNNASQASNDSEYTGAPKDLVLQRALPPSPPIQPSGIHLATEQQDTTHFFDEYRRLAASYGKDTMPDHQAHDRIPVDAAIQLLAASGIPSGPSVKDIPAPQGPGKSMPTPYSDGGRGSTDLDRAAAPGIPGK